jgi:hypothetical protein
VREVMDLKVIERKNQQKNLREIINESKPQRGQRGDNRRTKVRNQDDYGVEEVKYSESRED